MRGDGGVVVGRLCPSIESARQWTGMDSRHVVCVFVLVVAFYNRSMFVSSIVPSIHDTRQNSSNPTRSHIGKNEEIHGNQSKSECRNGDWVNLEFSHGNLGWWR